MFRALSRLGGPAAILSFEMLVQPGSKLQMILKARRCRRDGKPSVTSKTEARREGSWRGLFQQLMRPLHRIPGGFAGALVVRGRSRCGRPYEGRPDVRGAARSDRPLPTVSSTGRLSGGGRAAGAVRALMHRRTQSRQRSLKARPARHLSDREANASGKSVQESTNDAL